MIFRNRSKKTVIEETYQREKFKNDFFNAPTTSKLLQEISIKFLNQVRFQVENLFLTRC